MAETIYIVKQYSTLRDGPDIHGAVIPGAAIGIGTIVVIGTVHENISGLIVGPSISQPGGLIQPNGSYKGYNKEAWIEMAHLGSINADEHEYRIITDAATGEIKSSVMIR